MKFFIKFYIYSMPEQTHSPSKRSGSLDLLRFFAVLFVFFGHYTDTFNDVYQIVPANLKYAFISRYATTALIMFFMVSGYVVTMTSVKRNLKDFLITRLSRIYPLFWVSCIVAFLLPKVIYTHSYLGNYPFKTFLVNLTMVPMAFGYPMINPVFHTLMTELAFYMLIAVIIVFKLWNRILVVISIMLALCIANILFLDLPAYIMVLPFLAGMLFYLIQVRPANAWRLYVLLAINFTCAIIGTKPLADQLDTYSKEPHSHHVWAFVLILIVIYAVFLLVALKKINIKGNRFYQFLGEIAYPFYLFHIYFLCFYWYFRDRVQADLLLYGILLVIILTSWALNVWIEKPLSKLASYTLTAITNYFHKKDINKKTEITF